jgi:pimeloyl-ACP methyl ester carboxylesterase
LFFFHGTPGSRLEFSSDDLIIKPPGVHFITPERPGYGISDPKPDRELVDWPNDVLELADHLGIDSFAVAGESGGCPHALACAYRCPDRVTMALLLASPCPADFPGATKGMSLGNRLGFVINRYAPWLVRRMMRGYADAFKKDPERFVDDMAAQVSAPDKALLMKESYRNAIIRGLHEAYRQGSDGQILDVQLIAASRGWGFRFSEISVPVFMWYGEEDTLVSRNMAERLGRELPQCTFYYVPQAGHLLSDHPEVIKQFRSALSGI